VQPGWELLLGWEEVRERWARIFSNIQRVRVALSGVWARVEGSVGWVACTARITTAFAEGFDEATVQPMAPRGPSRLAAAHSAASHGSVAMRSPVADALISLFEGISK
jgi:hypothetical protein